MKKIYLMRHGESVLNAAKIIQGWKPVGLSDKGILQAKLAGQRLSPDIKYIYTSTLKRALDTTDILSLYLPAAVVIPHPDLRDIVYSPTLEGLSHLGPEYLSHKRKMDTDYNYRAIDGESRNDFHNRLSRVVGEIESQSHSVLVVTHRKAIEYIYTQLTNEIMPVEYIEHGEIISIDL